MPRPKRPKRYSPPPDRIERMTQERNRILNRLGLGNLGNSHGGICCPDLETARRVRDAFKESDVIGCADEIHHSPARGDPYGHPDQWYADWTAKI